MTLTLPTSSSSFQEKNTNPQELILLRREIFELKREIVSLRADANLWKTQHQKAKKREEAQKKEIQNLKAKVRLREQQLFCSIARLQAISISKNNIIKSFPC